jgi:hypothetical protein
MLLSDLEALVRTLRMKAKDANPHVLFYNDDERKPAMLDMPPVKDIKQNEVINPGYDTVAPLKFGDYAFPLHAFKDR